jgi:hypothetical protein
LADSEKLSLTYDGRLASGGEMLLYEYGRSQYAFSRLVTTVEQYRRRRVILQKIVPASRVKIRVRAPERGSFRLDASVDTSPTGARGTANFDVLFAVVLDRLIPGLDEFQSLAEALAKIKAAEWQSGDDTGGEFDARARSRVAEIATGDSYASDVLLELLLWAQSSVNRAIARADISQEVLDRAIVIVRSDVARKDLIRRASFDLDSAEIDKLTARVRPMFNELAVPLGDSADTISIGSPGNRSLFYAFDRERLGYIGTRELDSEEIEIEAKIKNFDVESGNGSMRISGEKGVRYFSLDPAERDEIQHEIVLGMNKSQVTLGCAVYKEANGIITSYMVRSIL